MAHPSLSFSSAPESPELQQCGPPTPEQPGLGNIPSSNDPRKAIACLRLEIAGSAWDANTSLQRIVELAGSLTAANGAAIALRQGEQVICQARAGELAPPLGVKLDLSSGISGECLRRARPVRCEDTTKDSRVDPQVREYLGLWSLAAVPIFAGSNAIGILEVFSALPYSFSLPHLEFLEELAALVASLQAGSAERVRQQQATRAALGAESRAAVPLRGLGWLWHRVGPLLQSEREMLIHLTRTQSGRRKLLISVLAVMTISLGLGWILGQSSPSSSPHSVRAGKPARPVTRISPASANGSISLAWSPHNAATGKPANPGTSLSSALVMAAEREKLNNKDLSPAARSQVKPTPVVISEAQSAPDPSTSGDNVGPETAPNLLAARSSSEDPLRAMLSAPPTMPEAAMKVSAGLTQGVVVRRVEPIYPPEARMTRLEGSVVLQATVAEDGTMHNVKVISGPPLLARAAESAVARWRYRPFLLNGRPIAMRTEITVDFKLPSP